MLRHDPVLPPEHIYPIDDWRMVQSRFEPCFLPQDETIFATANGYLGIRSSFEEGGPVAQEGTYVNGFHETWPIVYGEKAYGFAEDGQTIVDVTRTHVVKLYVDDESFYLPSAELVEYERALDMRNATLDRDVLWLTPSGKRVRIRTRRLVSFSQRHIAALSYEVTVLDAEAPVVLRSEMVTPRPDTSLAAAANDPRQASGFKHRVLEPAGHHASDARVVLSYRTANSGMTFAVGMEHVVDTECGHSIDASCSEDRGYVVISVDARPGVPIRLTKFASYHTSTWRSPRELTHRVGRSLDRVRSQGLDHLLGEQRAYMDEFWRRSDVQITGAHPRAQQCVRFNLFHLLQATGRADGMGVPAKGLTGQAYEGHYFWDAEIYVLPFLLYTEPRLARSLLKLRHSHLDKARERARQVGQRGALFPWRTINGDEASAYYAAGTAQYHINADICYALKKYVDVTGDFDFLHRYGAEILVETARLWADLGFYPTDRPGEFHIHGVTGPDEYNTVVNDNAYTNLMARHNLRYAAQVVEDMRDHHPGMYSALVHDTHLAEREIAEWRLAAECMFVPYDSERGIHPQDAAFLDREPWDFENTPSDRYPLLLHYHPLVIYRHQVIKQTDIVMAMFLLGQEFTKEQKQRNFDYYDPLTTGDSSLSACIQSIVAADLGYSNRALRYLRAALLMDLANVGGNVRDGVHIASMGGTWMALVFGIAGLRDDDGEISFSPQMPSTVEKLRFPLAIRDRELVVDITQDHTTYTLRAGSDLVICHAGEEIVLATGVPVTVKT